MLLGSIHPIGKLTYKQRKLFVTPLWTEDLCKVGVLCLAIRPESQKLRLSMMEGGKKAGPNQSYVGKSIDEILPSETHRTAASIRTVPTIGLCTSCDGCDKHDMGSKDLQRRSIPVMTKSDSQRQLPQTWTSHQCLHFRPSLLMIHY
jgi:hypothetical protein